MKKIIFFILIVVVVLVVAGYVVAFTKMGNNLLKPLVQSKINQYSPISLQLKEFVLSPSEVIISATHEDILKIKLKAHFSLLSQSFEGNLIAKDPSNPKSKTLNIKSHFKGSIRDFFVDTSGAIANSDSHIHAKIKSFEIQELQAKITGLKLDELLVLLQKPPYISGDVDIDTDLSGNLRTQTRGKLNIKIQKGTMNAKLAKENLHINIPKDNFSLNLRADFEDNLIKDELDFISDFGNINAKGDIQIPTLQINNQYTISLSDISPLGLLLSKNIRGSFASSGTLKGDTKTLLAEGSSNIANSNSNYSLTLSEFAFAKLRFDVKKISIDKLLWMLYEPQYINGIASFMGNMSDSKSLSISGRAKANTNPNIIKKHLQINVPDVYFTIQTGAMINDGVGKFDLDTESTLGYFRLKKGDIDLTNMAIDGNYDMLIRDLSKLEGLIGRSLSGKIAANGNIKYDNIFNADFKSTSLGGEMSGRINPKNLYVNFDGVSIKKLLDMLEISSIINGNTQGELNYDFTSQKGKISASIKDGKIAHTQIANIFKKYRGIDTDLQVFEGANFFSKIHGGMLDGKLTMQSNDLELDSQYLQINIPKNTIHSKFKFSSNQDYIYLLIDGNLNAPKMQVDASALLKKDTLKNIQNSETFKKIIPPQKQEKAKKLLDEVFKKL